MPLHTIDWTAIALARDVPAGTTRAVILDERELVIWRGTDGAAHVWEDRCPHRGMRLSFGFVRDGALNCLYHGWAYGGDGGCRRIPAHPDLNVPGSIRANVQSVVEAGGMIWTGTGGLEVFSQLPAGVTPVCSLAVDADPAEIAAAAGAASGLEGARLMSLRYPGGSLRIGWHRVGRGKTMLHAVTDGGDAASALRRLRELRAAAEGRAAA